ncbi:hypothetical protein [Clostridium polynesiense]|uniref:hypothetical protein n=1 Tax=Clostridium polynesiense TaxID=1325933 RepID=UPI00058B375F|nr:hypothetical protein [Clostridium polynesiense]
MGRFYVSFENNETKDTSSGISIPVTYHYWKPLIEHFINTCTGFRLDCWEDEKEAVKSAEILGRKTESYAAGMVSFENSISPEFIEEVLNSPLDKEGKIKWFGVNLKKDDEYMLCCQHYGSEFVTGWLKDEDADFIKSVIPEDFTFTVYDEE